VLRCPCGTHGADDWPRIRDEGRKAPLLFTKRPHQLVGEMFRRSSLLPPPADEGPLWPPCHAIVLRHDRNGLARNHREQQTESQLRDIERIRNKKAELRRKAE